MEGLYKNKYRIKTTRLSGWDYSQNGLYFITVCTLNRKNYFGDIFENQVKLSKIGEVVERCWLEIPKHFLNVLLDEFVVMPNHIHGIVVINNHVETQYFASQSNVVSETQNIASLRLNKFGPQSNNLASIIRGFKVGVKKWATVNNIDFQWQPRFYDHIIRDEADFNRIKKYIQENPINWEADRNNLENLYM